MAELCAQTGLCLLSDHVSAEFTAKIHILLCPTFWRESAKLRMGSNVMLAVGYQPRHPTTCVTALLVHIDIQIINIICVDK